VVIGGAAALLVATALGFGPLVRNIAQGRAAARGLELELGSVRPGWLSIHLGGAEVGLAGAPALRVTLNRVVVHITPWLSLREVELDGGEVVVQGAPGAVMEQLKAWRERHGSRPENDGSGGNKEPLPIHGTGFLLTWTGFDSSSAVQALSGIHFERSARKQSIGFEKGELQSSWGRVTATAGTAELGRGPRGRALESLRLEQIVGHIAIPQSTPEPDPPELVPAPPKIPLTVSADRRVARNAVAAASSERRQLERWLTPVAMETWTRRSEQLNRLRDVIASAMLDGAEVNFERVQLELAHGESVLNIGPAPFRLYREGDVVNAALSPPASAHGRRLEVTGRLPLTEAPVELSFEGGPISLETLGVREGDFGLLGVDRSELTLATRIELSPAGALSVSASGRLGQLALEHRSLAPEPLRDMDLAWSGLIDLDLQRRKLEITDGMLGVARVAVHVSGSIEAVAEDLRVSVSVQVPKTPCEDLLQAAPRALLPQLEGLKLGGFFELDSRVAFDSSAPKDTQVEWELDNECKVVETPAAVDPRRFREPFQHVVLEPDGRATELSTGPSTEHWVSLSDITPNMETALVVCEDSRFFSHKGFDNKAIRDSILDNVRAGHFVRGASTLSMQLAKNLYLGREKTLSRKLQEAAFTLLLEERLSKEDILELYLNVVEFGPGVYGIRNAATHYFNSHPGELSLAQALYLGSVLPNPKATHFQEDGALRPRWAQHLQHLMRIAHKIKRISDDELEAGLAERLTFGQAHPSSDSDFLFGAPLYELSDG
jgi:hypothetical protein